MSKVFNCDAQLDGKVYAVTRLIHDYTPSGYEEPESDYSDYAEYNQIQQDMVDAKQGNISKPRFCKYINQTNELLLKNSLMYYLILFYRYT